jgi:hypothetical protein
MKTTKSTGQKLPTHDYSPAVQGALSWLGKRYLLAEPPNRRDANAPMMTPSFSGELRHAETNIHIDRSAALVNRGS